MAWRKNDTNKLGEGAIQYTILLWQEGKDYFRLNMKFAWNPQVVYMSWNIYVSMPILNPLLTTPLLLLTLTPISLPPLSDAIEAENIVSDPLKRWSLFPKIGWAISWLSRLQYAARAR